MDGADDTGRRQWRRIAATVKPLKRKTAGKVVQTTGAPHNPDHHAELDSPSMAKPRKTAPTPAKPGSWTPDQVRGDEKEKKARSARQLDGTWERQLRGGRLVPDMEIDLHGHSLDAAHVRLARALDRAVAMGARVILVIAGKPRGPDEAPRGAIRRELAHWLSHGPHAARILSVRGAHPRHGGAGAVYVLLRKPAPAR